MNFFSSSVITAAGRHVGTAVSTAAAVLVAVGMMQPDQSAALIESVKTLTHGVQEVVVSVGAIVTVGMTTWAGAKASFASKAASVAANPDVAAVVMKDEAAAAAIPSPKVVGIESAAAVVAGPQP